MQLRVSRDRGRGGGRDRVRERSRDGLSRRGEKSTELRVCGGYVGFGAHSGVVDCDVEGASVGDSEGGAGMGGMGSVARSTVLVRGGDGGNGWEELVRRGGDRAGQAGDLRDVGERSITDEKSEV